MPITGGPLFMFEHQDPALLSQPNPVQNTWYTVLDTTRNVRVYNIAIGVGTANETLEIRVTLDGTAYTGSLAATFGTTYYAVMDPNAIAQVLQVNPSATAYNWYRAFLMEGHSVMIEVRKTTVTGAGNLLALVEYGVLTPV